MSGKMNIESAWRLLFERHDIPGCVQRDGLFRISAKEINTLKEARLMAKFDSSAQLPRIFKEHQFSILPVTRGDYVIGPFATHVRLRYPQIQPRPIRIPQLETLDASNLYSESAALLFAYNSGIIADMLGSAPAFTVNGRMSSGSFSFSVDSVCAGAAAYPVDVCNAQVEIDAGYETDDAFCICEAKNIAAEEILIRQLYYPYRLWSGRIRKRIRPLFVVYSNDVFHLFEYRFAEQARYNSLELVQYRAYAFADALITTQDLEALWRGTQPLPEPDCTFPQADSFARVLDLISVLVERPLTRDEVTMKYEFDNRQTDYYITACQYLGLVSREQKDGERIFCLTRDARGIMRKGYREKNLLLAARILRCPVFHRVFAAALPSMRAPDKRTVCRIMAQAGLGINDTTIERRSSTVRSWIDWIFHLAQKI